MNYLADFLPADRKLVHPYCKNCKSRQPLLRYFFWPASCPTCKQKRGSRAWVVAIILTLASIWLWKFPPPGMGYIISMVVLVYFCIVMVIDIEHRLILHPVSLIGAAIGLTLGIILHGLPRTLIGGLGGFGIMLLLYLGGGLFVRVLSRWRDYSEIDEALGFGDVVLGGVLGLMLGWSGIILGLVLAILIAGIVSLIILIYMVVTRRYQASKTVAYGPFLVLSAFILLYLKEFITYPIGW